ncbi:cell envelope biogenesis protein OmpA [Aggregatimonas sangjinii]|uniref:Cell envelope biogenesis protein OmpA n=2 Tax=Aggregatimonas sangjinii TaxID=2583587 RepID=A0A5B7SZB4_9FLAO|nr:cell envelope biogenesis protein OmpA [Aggregatimonas sangjinii]
MLLEREETFSEAADKNGIAHRTFDDITSAEDGFYVINAVLSKTRNLKRTVKKLNKKGFDAGFIKHQDNGLHYVYLNHYTDWKKAIAAVNSDFDGKYKDDVWILKVEKDMVQTATIEQDAAETTTTSKETATAGSNDSNVDLDQVSYGMLSNAEAETKEVPLVYTGTNKSKLIQKADSYFDKMWYAEAAELYEQALSKGKENYTVDIIQKAADAHYFNTNMEKAYEWYNILYEQQGKDFSTDNTFRYSHALKGTGKYGRAKRLMRLYNKKMSRGEGETVDLSSNEALPNEIILDNILAATPSFEIKNLAINTEYSEFSPMFLDTTEIVFASAKDSSFLKTRKYKWNDQPYLDLYVAKINEETQDLKDALKFSKKINTKYHEASVTFSPDNTTMYFTRNNFGKKLKRDKNGVNHLKIYVSNKVDGEWEEAREVSFNSDDYSTGHPALSPDGKKLYFVSDMPGSIGQTDIFVVDVLEGGQFSEPKNLGPNINTEQREMFPFINEEKLFFASDGHVGLGGLDIYEVAIDEEKGFLDVVNMGKPINSNKDDFSYIANKNSLKGFFASNRKGGKGDDDIYSFERIVPEKVAENLNAIAGVVTELVSGELMPKTMVELLDENGIKLKEMETAEDGSFMFEDLDSNTKYVLRTKKGEYFENEVPVTSKDNELVNQNVSLKRLEEMIALEEGIKKLKTEMIFFDFDKSYIRNDAATELNKLVEVMTEYPTMVIKIESHTDSRGSAQYNKYLSDKRAKSTRDYIISQGIDAGRIQSANGYGEEMLLNECNGRVRCTEEQHFRNRRSEFIIVNM